MTPTTNTLSAHTDAREQPAAARWQQIVGLVVARHGRGRRAGTVVLGDAARGHGPARGQITIDRSIGPRRARSFAAMSAAAAGLSALWALALAGPAQATVTSCPTPVITGATAVVTCLYTGDAQTWTVPAGVTSAVFDVQGAQGGTSIVAAGGLGGEATTDLALTPGATVTLVVGGQGGWNCPSLSPGGFNGGGDSPATNPDDTCPGAGGGGASDVRIGGSALSNRVLVAGGGGGIDSCPEGVQGAGGGGGLTGGNGIGSASCNGGAGGNQTGTTGSGQLGVGSDGAAHGGGGGGGYYGGAGGAGGGGGGSGFGPIGTTFNTGVHSGNGRITIIYTVPITVTNPGNQKGTVGTAASLQVSASDSTSGQTLRYSATGLPAGLSINSSSGLISGTPTTAATYNTTITASDATGASDNASFTWTISPPPAADLAITNYAPSSVVSGNKLTYTITATNTGGLDAAGVTVTDPFSGNAHLNLRSASTTQGTCSTKAGTVECSVGTLLGESSATITIVAIATQPGTFTNTATVTASNVTGDLDDSSPAMTTVIGN